MIWLDFYLQSGYSNDLFPRLKLNKVQTKSVVASVASFAAIGHVSNDERLKFRYRNGMFSR